MKRKQGLKIIAAAAIIVMAAATAHAAKAYMAFGGGPVGGTFNYFANAIAIYMTKNIPDVEVSSEGSGGSVENLKRIHKHDVDFGIVYSGDLFLGRNGQLVNDPAKYDKVRAIAALYGAPAQLVVLKKSGITTAAQLVGRKVGVGNAGSGAALTAERFFKTLGIWDKIEPQFLGYSPAASAFKDRKLDAFWITAGFPNASVIEACAQDDVLLVDIEAEARQSGFFEAYPFYSPVVITKGVYRGVDADVNSFQDTAYWCAGESVPEDVVYQTVKAIFSPEGLAHMISAHKAAEEMKVEKAVDGLSIPLHPGAYKFWTEMGLNIPENLKP